MIMITSMMMMMAQTPFIAGRSAPRSSHHFDPRMQETEQLQPTAKITRKCRST